MLPMGAEICYPFGPWTYVKPCEKKDICKVPTDRVHRPRGFRCGTDSPSMPGVGNSAEAIASILKVIQKTKPKSSLGKLEIVVRGSQVNSMNALEYGDHLEINTSENKAAITLITHGQQKNLDINDLGVESCPTVPNK